MRQAFTIGARKSYDEALLDTESPPNKIGVRHDWDPPYEGGWVWRTAEEAHAFIASRGESLGFKAAVYELDLPVSWERDVFPEPSPVDGVHRLRHDARIVRRVDFEPSG